MLEQVGIGNWNALKLRQKAVQWLKTNGSRAMDDGKVIAARCLGLLPSPRVPLVPHSARFGLIA